ncbi:hypothetical protein PILCRDRAFT_826587 [Piloderma croceum F 1598]|uniref:Secreted protein n=1 Tax=Piloderma croceum (strain F 1598) TaxID=765440 RepID=A0A0C3F945_PILCF|nr:hypothetical protein PILCRDRAFT_826587 [Piloderma croceum F 1598]
MCTLYPPRSAVFLLFSTTTTALYSAPTDSNQAGHMIRSNSCRPETRIFTGDITRSSRGTETRSFS